MWTLAHTIRQEAHDPDDGGFMCLVHIPCVPRSPPPPYASIWRFTATPHYGDRSPRYSPEQNDSAAPSTCPMRRIQHESAVVLSLPLLRTDTIM